MDSLRQSLSIRISRYRKMRHWTQHDLAQIAGIAVSTLRGYEQGKRWPDPEMLAVLAKALGVMPIDLFCDHDADAVTPDQALEVLRKFVEKVKTDTL